MKRFRKQREPRTKLTMLERRSRWCWTHKPIQSRQSMTRVKAYREKLDMKIYGEVQSAYLQRPKVRRGPKVKF